MDGSGMPGLRGWLRILKMDRIDRPFGISEQHDVKIVPVDSWSRRPELAGGDRLGHSFDAFSGGSEERVVEVFPEFQGDLGLGPAEIGVAGDHGAGSAPGLQGEEVERELQVRPTPDSFSGRNHHPRCQLGRVFVAP